MSKSKQTPVIQGHPAVIQNYKGGEGSEFISIRSPETGTVLTARCHPDCKPDLPIQGKFNEIYENLDLAFGGWRRSAREVLNAYAKLLQRHSHNELLFDLQRRAKVRLRGLGQYFYRRELKRKLVGMPPQWRFQALKQWRRERVGKPRDISGELRVVRFLESLCFRFTLSRTLGVGEESNGAAARFRAQSMMRRGRRSIIMDDLLRDATRIDP